MASSGQGQIAWPRNVLFVTLMGLAKGIEAYTEASFLPISTDSLCLRVTQMPSSWRSGDFRADDNNRHTNRSLYPLHMRTG